jgi:hypothetical protein
LAFALLLYHLSMTLDWPDDVEETMSKLVVRKLVVEISRQTGDKGTAYLSPRGDISDGRDPDLSAYWRVRST